MPRKPKKRRIFVDTSGKKAIRIAKKALSMVAGEMKQLSSTGTATAIPDGNGILIQLSNLQQGDSNVTREGNSITIKHLEMRLMLKIAAAAFSSQVRVMLIRDKQANGAVLTVNEVLQSSANFLGLISPRDVNHLQRFVVLYDRVHVLNQNITTTLSTTRHVKKLKKQNIKIRYDANVGDITDVQTNSYSMLLISNEPTNEPTFDHFVRLKFIDN